MASNAALVTAPYLASDGTASIAVTQPAGEGQGFNLVEQVTIAGSAGVTAALTPGTPSVPPNYAMSIPTSAVTTSGGSGPMSINTAANNFALGVLGTLIVDVERTVVVGGKLGTMPNAVDLPTAVSTYATQLASATSSAPWTLLIMPGVYTSGSTVSIPLNVHITAFIYNTVFINHAIQYTDSTGNANINAIHGINMNDPTSAISITTSGKSGGTYAFTMRDSLVQNGSTFSANMRALGVPSTNYYQDNIYVLDTTFDVLTAAFAFSFTGGITNFQNCRIRIPSGSMTLVAPGISTQITRVQFLDSTVSIPFVQNSSSYVSMRGCVLGGTWQIGQTSSTSTTLLINACRPNADTNAVIPNPWQLFVYSTATVNIRNTFLPYVLSRSGTNNWSVSFPNIPTVLSGTQGAVDRPFRITLLGPPNQSIPSTLTVSITVPLATSPEASAPATGTQPQVTQVQLGGTTQSFLSTTSTTSSIVVAATVTSADGDKVAIEVIPPSYTGTEWYRPTQ